MRFVCTNSGVRAEITIDHAREFRQVDRLGHVLVTTFLQTPSLERKISSYDRNL